MHKDRILWLRNNGYDSYLKFHRINMITASPALFVMGCLYLYFARSDVFRIFMGLFLICASFVAYLRTHSIVLRTPISVGFSDEAIYLRYKKRTSFIAWGDIVKSNVKILYEHAIKRRFVREGNLIIILKTGKIVSSGFLSKEMAIATHKEFEKNKYKLWS